MTPALTQPGGDPVGDRDLAVGGFRLDAGARILRSQVGQAPVSPIACRFLEVLAERGGDTVGRRELVERLWSGNHLVGDPALNRLASEVRRAAREAGGASLLETVHGRGYRLVGQPRASRPAPAANNRPPTGWIVLALAILAIVIALAFVLILANGLIWGLAEPD